MYERKKTSISILYFRVEFFKCFLLIISLFPKFTIRFGFITPTPTFSSVTIKVLLILILLTISYGLLRLKRWGYWLMIAYNMFFLVVSIIFLLKLTEQSFYHPSFIGLILGLIITFPAKRYFIKTNEST